MNTSPFTTAAGRWRRTMLVPLVASVAIAPFLAACGSGDPGTEKTSSLANGSAVTVAGVKISKVSTIADAVPASLRSEGIKAIFYNFYPPEFFEKNGSLVGAQVDLAQAMAAVMGVSIKSTSSASFDSFIPGVQSGRYNAAFGAFLVTPERTKVVDIVSTESTGTGFASKAGGDAPSLTTDLDLCGQKFAGITASAYVASVVAVNEDCKAAGKPELTMATYPTDSAAELAVQAGRQDYYVSGAQEIAYRFEQAGAKLTAQPLNFKPVDTGIAVGKDSGLSQPLTEALNHLIETGVYQKIMTNWHLENFMIPEAKLFG